MFGFIVFFIFILFFILIIVVKDKAVLLKIVKAFIVTIFGGFVVMGMLAILTGISETLNGNSGLNQLFFQVGTGILFIAAGSVPLYVFFISREVSLRKFEKRKKQYPDTPWMWVEHWSNKRIVYLSKGPTALVWVVLTGLTTGLAFVSYVNREVILSKIKNHDLEAIAFFVILALILIPCFCYGVSLLRGHLKFGNSIFEMSTYPGVVGGELTGRILTTIRKMPEKGVDLGLRCGYRDLTSQAGKRLRNTDITKTLWETTRKARFENLSMGHQGVTIPVSFSIPANAQESDAWSPDKRIIWTLSAASTVGGVKYFSSFDVPIFIIKPSL